jgi:hypothetical protein
LFVFASLRARALHAPVYLGFSIQNGALHTHHHAHRIFTASLLMNDIGRKSQLGNIRESVTATLSSTTQLQVHMGLLNLIVS